VIWDHTSPCTSCPYRRDAPRGLWHRSEKPKKYEVFKVGESLKWVVTAQTKREAVKLAKARLGRGSYEARPIEK
jgi:hypothetical protein